MNEAELVAALNQDDLVVADPNKFKIKLAIGEDAYSSLKMAKTLQKMWDVKGVASTGAAVAASPAIATTFFGGGGGLLSALGFGAAAATPVGWIVAAAVVSGGAYYGAMKVVGSYTSSRVETIPKFINTPLDLLGATLFDMMAGLALKVADFAGEIDDDERQAVIGYFDDVWGISTEYSSKALPLVEQQIKLRSLKDMARMLAEFQVDNPDCNPSAMQKDIKQFLEEIAHADGEMDEREELAIETIERELSTQFSIQNQAMRSAKKYFNSATEVATEASTQVQQKASGLINSFMGRFKK